MRLRLTNLGAPLGALAVLSAWLTACASAPKTTGDRMRSRLPPAVLNAIDMNCPGAEIAKVEAEKEAGIRLYDVEFKAGRGEIEVAADGRIVAGPKKGGDESKQR